MRPFWMAFFLMLVHAAADSQPTGVLAQGEAGARQAAEALRRAAVTLGGRERLGRIGSLEWETNGRLFSLNQGPMPDRPLEYRLRQRHFTDFDAGLTYVAFDFAGPESSFRRTAVLREEAPSEDLREVTALAPAAVVRRLLSRPADLRLLSRDGRGTVIAGIFLGRLVELEIGPDGLPRALSQVIDDELFGDSVRRFEYSDYRSHDGWTFPARVRQREAGRVALDTELAEFAVDGDRPGWSVGLESRRQEAGEQPVGLAAERLAPRVYFLRRHGGADYHGLAVELDEGWMILETPAEIGEGSELRTALARISDKPIAYAAATHHHGDHSAGMAAVGREGVTILTTLGNVGFFSTMVQASRGFAEAGGAARVRVLEQGERIGPVQFFDVGPTPHVAEHLVFYFPEHRLLFHSDMGRFNDDGSVEPGRPQTCALLAFIEVRGLAVDRIVSGHGRPGTLDDLRQSVAARETPCPAA